MEDVLHIKNHPLVPNSILVYGYIYHCKTGKMIEVKEATKVGARQI
jgi:carbonic anhydrase